jgi:hypothetical protein
MTVVEDYEYLSIPTLNQVERLRRKFRDQVTNTAIPVPKPYSDRVGTLLEWLLVDLEESRTECESGGLGAGCQQDSF